LIDPRPHLLVVVDTLAEVVLGFASALFLANAVSHQHELRTALLLAGGLLLPFIDSRLRRSARRGGLTVASALAGTLALVVAVSERGPGQLMQLFWVEGGGPVSANLPFLAWDAVLMLGAVLALRVGWPQAGARSPADASP